MEEIKNVTENTEEVVNETSTTETESTGGAWLFIKIAGILLLAYGLIVWAWNNYISFWWNNQAPQWLKIGLFWFLWLDISWTIYKKAKTL